MCISLPMQSILNASDIFAMPVFFILSSMTATEAAMPKVDGMTAYQTM